MTDIPTIPPVPSKSTPTPAPAVSTNAPVIPPADLMLMQFKMLDPTRQGVGLDKLRPFYPRIGWDVIGAIVKELETAGLLKSKNVMSAKGTVAYQTYTWLEG